MKSLGESIFFGAAVMFIVAAFIPSLHEGLDILDSIRAMCICMGWMLISIRLISGAKN